MDDLSADMEKQVKRKDETEAKLRGLAEDIQQGSVALDEIRESLATSDLYKRNIEDNIRYRRQKAEIATLSETIRKKEEDCNVNTNEALDFDIDKLTKAIEQRKRKVGSGAKCNCC
jgi:chromosome segregation ATPase